MHAVHRAEKQRLAKLYEAFRRINAGGSSLDQLVTIILKAVRNLVNSDHNLLLFVDNSRDQLWTKWTLGTVMDDKVSNPCAAAGTVHLFSTLKGHLLATTMINKPFPAGTVALLIP